MTIGERIRSARKKAGLTQAQLSDKSGVAAISIHQYESGKRHPRLEQLLRISSALNVDIIDLTGIEDDMEGYNFTIIKKGTHDIPLSLQNIHSIRDVYNYLSDDEKSELWYKLLTPLHAQLNEAFEQLNEDGQGIAVQRVRELGRIPEYRAETAPQPPPAPQEGKDTTPTPDAPETPPEGE